MPGSLERNCFLERSSTFLFSFDAFSVVDDFDDSNVKRPELGRSVNWTPEGGYPEDIAGQSITPKTAPGN